MKNPFSMEETYREVYIIDFKKEVTPPKIREEKLKRLGKWFKKNGHAWVCQSKIPIEEFKIEFLNHLSGSVSEDELDIKKGTWPVAVLGL